MRVVVDVGEQGGQDSGRVSDPEVRCKSGACAASGLACGF